MEVTATTEFGRCIREKYFMFKEGFVHLNQGSYSSYPSPVREALRSLQDEVQAEPDGFVRYIYPRRLNEVRQCLASLMHAEVDEVVLVPNATTGLNAVLRNIRFQDGEKIAYIQGIYGAIEKTVDYMVETTPVDSICIPFDPATDDDDHLLQTFREILEANHGRIKLAIFDTVMSMPGFRMPFERLTRLCKEFQVFSVVDGAHGIGLIDMDLHKLNPDFLVTNCHKWLFVPHTCSLLYVASRNQYLMRSSLPTSHGFRSLRPTLKEKQYISSYEPPASVKPFVAQFEYYGTIDNAPPLCSGSA